jgi:hypothetical protein
MWHNPKNYYQIYRTDHKPGHTPVMIEEVKGLGNAQILVDSLMRRRSEEEKQQDISYYMSNFSSSRRKMLR